MIKNLATAIFFILIYCNAFTQSRADIDTLHQMLANANR